MTYENEKTGIIEDQKTQEIPADTAGIDMIGGEPIAETAALPPELLNELGETKTIPIADIVEHGGRWDPYKGESIPDESAPAPKRKRALAIAAVAAAVLVVAIGVGVAVASPSADSGQQPTASSSAASSSSSSSASKASKSSSSSASAKADEAKEELQEERGAGDQQDQGAGQDVGQAAAVSGGSGNSGGNSSGASEPQRHWVDEVGHNEQVLVQAAYDEPVYETVRYYYCNSCGCRVDDTHAHISAAPRQQHDMGTITEQVQVDTIHHDAVYETQYVVDVPGHWE